MQMMPSFSLRAQTGTQQELSWAPFRGVFVSVCISVRAYILGD